RHESLRTVFTTIDGQPHQVVLPATRVALSSTDLREAGEGLASAEEAAIGQRQAERSFDLEAGPLLRAHLVRLGPEASVLHLAVHHIVADGWSMGLIRRELKLLVQARVAGHPHVGDEPPIQYGDYAVWQRQRLAGSDLSGELSWWSEQLAGVPTLLDLPTDRPRPPAASFAGALIGRPLPPGLTRRCCDLGRSHGATPFMTYLAAFAALLQRWSGQDDLVVGMPVAGRTRLETEEVIGLFVNSLAVRVRMAGEPTFADVLAEVRDRVSHAQDHQDLPFEEIVRHVAPQRQLGHSPLFQVMFTTYQGDNTDGSVDEEAGVPHTATAKFDLTMTVDEDIARPYLWLEYATDLFDGETARHVLRCFVRLLESVTADPECRLAEIPLLDDEEAHREATTAEEVAPAVAAAGLTAAGRLEGRAAVVEADDLAATGERGTMTHAELGRAANRLAHHLLSEGLTRGAVVAISLPPGPALLTALLGVHRAGCAFLLLDLALPAARRATLMSDCGATYVLDAKALAAPAVAAESEQRPAVDVDGNTPAYVVYTSGSTGSPKGVVVARRALHNHVAAVIEAYELRPADRVLQFASPGFDVAVEEMLPTVAVGAAVHFTRLCGPLPFQELERACGAGGVSVLNLPASYWHEWVATLAGDRPLPASLRLVVVGSEPVHPDAVARWHEVVGERARLLVAYGTSETTITNALYQPAADRNWVGERRMPVGYPIRGNQLLVRDAARRPVPSGFVGELYIGGSSLAGGYVGDDVLTAARFLSDPLSPGQRIYRSGDVARRRLDGAVEILGRADDQIKLRGQRIEPAEVEAHLLRQPGVRAAAVVARKDRQGRMHLAAYLVPNGGKMRADVVHAALRDQLPAYLVPSSYTPLAALPRTAGGKVDRQRLPDPLPAVPEDDHHQPATRTEEALARIWSEVLGIEGGRVSTHSNFFELGGDSILSLQLAWRIAREGMRVTLADLFENQTVAALAAAIDHSQPAAPAEAPVRGPVPLSPIQRWFFETGSPEPWHDNQAVVVRLARSVTAVHVEVALRALVERHEALRTLFRRQPEGWQATVVGADDVPLAFTVHPVGRRELDRIAEEAHAGLSLETGPLFRADLVGDDVDGQREYPWRLLLVGHHLVVDLVSWTILLSDLGLALQQQLAGHAVVLPAPTSSFATWVAELSEWANGTEASEDVCWWLNGPQAVNRLPVDRAQEAPQRAPAVVDQQVVRVTIGAPSLAPGTRIEDALIAALAVALAKWTGALGATTVRLDVEGHGREPLIAGVDVSRTVGWLTVTHPLTLTVDPTAPMATTLGSVRDRVRSVPRKGVGYGAVRYLRDPEDEAVRDLRGLSPAEVSFNYVGRMSMGQERDGLVTWGGPPPGPMRSPRAPLAYAIDVVAARQDDSVVVWLFYAATVHERSTIEALGNWLAEAMGALAGDMAIEPGADPPAVAAYPLVPIQEEMLVHTLSNEGSGAYVEHAVLDLAENTDVVSLRAAWAHCVDRHEILRTRFVPDHGGRMVQEVLASVTVPLRLVDWSHLGLAEVDERIEGLLQEDRRQGFDPGRAPLMRLVLVRLVAGYRLVWSHHHALLDGWSASLLLGEVDAAYRALVSGATPSSSPAHQFREYVEWHLQRTAAEDEAYWRQTLAGFDTPTLEPAAGAGPSSGRFAALEVTPTDDLRRRVEDRARSERLTLATMVTGAWAVVLSANSGQTDVVFGMTGSGRPPELPQAAEIVGLLITTHPVRVRVEPGTEVRSWLADLAAAQATSQLHAHASLSEIASWSDVAPPRSLFESLVVVENYPARRARGGTQRRSKPDGVHEVQVRESSNFPLNLVVAADLTLKVVYDADRFDPAWAGALLPQLLTALEVLADEGRQRLGEVSVLRPGDHRRILEEWNDSARPIPRLTLGELWSRAANAHSERIAIDGPEGTFTYSELERAVNGLAHQLLAHGVRPGDLVGVMGERSAESVAGVLAVVQVGAGYVPLDPSFPNDRLSLIADDTRMEVALTQGQFVDRLPETLRTSDRGVVVLDPMVSNHAAPGVSEAPSPPCGLTDDAVAYVMYTSGS
ncbi:MAG: amino acid adenylation domain-containing protein, partial [Actinobacteria bacterium]|nr:amino acid adenylation domain-containing protein [Actinomycetota bacterium]